MSDLCCDASNQPGQAGQWESCVRSPPHVYGKYSTYSFIHTYHSLNPSSSRLLVAQLLLYLIFLSKCK